MQLFKKYSTDILTLSSLALVLLTCIDFNNLGIIQYVFLAIVSVNVFLMINNWLYDFRLRNMDTN